MKIIGHTGGTDRGGSDLDHPRLGRHDAVEQPRWDAPSVKVSEGLDDLSSKGPLEEACVLLYNCRRDRLIFLKEAQASEEDTFGFCLGAQTLVMHGNLTTVPRREVGW